MRQDFARRLAVFEAGCTLDTVEAICTGDGIAADYILDRISSLVSKSLVVADISGRAQARYRLLETIREYALRKLDEAGETKQLRDCHLNLFLVRAEEAAPKLGEAYQQLWLNWLESEHDNLRTALAWSLESSHIEKGLRIACALVRFWEIRGYAQEGLAWFKRLLARKDEGTSPVVHVNALVYASFLAMSLGNGPETMAYGRQAVEAAEGISDKSNPALTFALAGLASGARSVGDYQTAFTVGEQALQQSRLSPVSSFYLGMSLFAQGENAIQLGSYDIARQRLDESLLLARQDGDAFRIAHTLNALGDLMRLERDYTGATSVYQEGVALLRKLRAAHLAST
jgi:tetratricopeptide (TPR) repeat protein